MYTTFYSLLKIRKKKKHETGPVCVLLPHPVVDGVFFVTMFIRQNQQLKKKANTNCFSK